MTPERRVKAKILKVLDNYESSVYYFMPVPGGYGRSSLDYVGSCRGHAFAIEAKAPEKDPTPRQEGIIEDMLKADMKVFVIHGEEAELEDLRQWLEMTSCS